MRAAASVELYPLVRAVVLAHITPHVTRTRVAIAMTGRLAFLPREGVQILIYRRDGRVWRPIGKARTRSDGHFTWRYGFKASAAGRTFAICAQLASPIYPFTPGSSRPTFVARGVPAKIRPKPAIGPLRPRKAIVSSLDAGQTA